MCVKDEKFEEPFLAWINVDESHLIFLLSFQWKKVIEGGRKSSKFRVLFYSIYVILCKADTMKEKVVCVLENRQKATWNLMLQVWPCMTS